jgi:hypothetical protein
MTEEEILHLDETALCLFARLQVLYEDAHAWFQGPHHDLQGDEKFFRLQDISNERDQVSLHLCEHIAYVLLPQTGYHIGTPGISLREALLIQLWVSQMNLQTNFEASIDNLHEILRTLKVTP